MQIGNYLQFAVMGKHYMKEVLGCEDPKVALINVGTENQKGNETIKQAYLLLEASELNFIGNVEGREIVEGIADVIVCDGFLGNVLLKFSEGIAGFFVQNLKQIYGSNIWTKLSYLFIQKKFKNFFKKIDYKEYGGVPLLGIKGKVMKAHGSSDRKAIKNAVHKAVLFGHSHVEKFIEQDFKAKGGEQDG
jgi:phosphate acyltransferase